MLTLTLTLIPFLPQGGQDVAASSRFLPTDRTLLAVEVAGTETLGRHAAAITQIAAMSEPRMGEFFTWLSENDKYYRVFHEHRPHTHKLLGSFDRGFTGAMVFTQSKWSTPQPFPYLLAAASDAKRTRGFQELLAKIVTNPAEGVAPLTKMEIALADSPVQMRQYRRQTGGFRAFQALYAAHRGRHATLFLQRSWDAQEAEKNERERAAIVETMGALLGLAGRQRGGDRIAPVAALPEGAVPLGRFVLRFHDMASSKEFGARRREQQEVRELGFWGFRGIQTRLYVHGGKAKERIEIHHKGIANDEFFESFAEGERGLGDVAGALPATTLAALRLGLDARRFEKWLAATLASGFRIDEKATAGAIRGALGLGAEAKLDELRSLTVFLVAPASGAPGLEPGLLLRIPGAPDQPKKVLQAIVSGLGASSPSPRRLGKGDDVVHYVSLKKALGPLGAAEGAAMSTLLGGGSLTAARHGDWLLLGCSPRTVGRLLRDVRAGKTLAQRDGFSERFPKASGRAIEAWFDWRAILGRLEPIENLLPLMVVGMLDGVPVGSSPPLPRARDFAKHVGEESLWSERADFGRVLHLEGGTLLSPTAWAASVFAIQMTDTLCRMYY